MGKPSRYTTDHNEDVEPHEPEASQNPFTGVNGRRNMAICAAVFCVFAYGVYHMTQKSEDVRGALPRPTPRPPAPTGKRVRFADEEASEESARLEDFQRDHERHLQDLSARMRAIQKNEEEIKQNEKLFSENSPDLEKFSNAEQKNAGYDEDQSSFEEEQNINTAFYTKDDLEKKRAAVNQLHSELVLQRQHLVSEKQQMRAGLLNSAKAYKQRYPSYEHPVVNEVLRSAV